MTANPLQWTREAIETGRGKGQTSTLVWLVKALAGTYTLLVGDRHMAETLCQDYDMKLGKDVIYPGCTMAGRRQVILIDSSFLRYFLRTMESATTDSPEPFKAKIDPPKRCEHWTLWATQAFDLLVEQFEEYVNRRMEVKR